MAMLAEPKRKRKWTLNPRGTLFTNDEDNVGHRLLKKLGWSKGKGLGREGQGDLEPIRIKYKNDAEGVGFEAKDDQWMAHHDEFSAMLGQLNGANATEEPEVIPVKSLESRSKKSKARVHYHKFTRGKDLSRYSATDLASILGKRSATQVVEEPKEEIEEEQPSPEDSVEHSHGVTTIHRGNINEYFASKMASLKLKNQTNALLQDEQSCSDEGIQSDVKDSNGKRVRFNDDLNVVKEFCKKKKVIEINGHVEDVEEVPAKIKKSKKSKDGGEALVLDEGVFEQLEDEVVDSTKKKKKKKQLEEFASELVTQLECETTETSKKKKKKKKDKGDREELIVLDEGICEEPRKKKKKKKRKTAELPEEVPETVISTTCTEEVTKKKKKKKKKNLEDSQCELLIEPIAETSIVAEETTPGKKKKRKNKQITIEEPIDVTENENKKEEAQIELLAETEQPKKKKKKKTDSISRDTGAEPEKAVKRKNEDTDTSSPKKKRKREINGVVVAEDPVEVELLATRSKFQQAAPDFSYYGDWANRPGLLKRATDKYKMAEFEKFKGSNLYSVPGYGWP